MGHQVGAVALDLLVRGDGAEDDFGEAAAVEGSVGYAADDFEGMFDDGDGEVGFVVDEAGDVVFGHFGELFLEDAFQACEDDVAFTRVVVVDYAELDYTVLLFDDCRFLGKGDHFGRRERRGVDLDGGGVSLIKSRHFGTN